VTASEKAVAGAYLVVFVVVLAYVLIIATKLSRLEREVAELAELARQKRAREPETQKAVVVGASLEGVWGNREVPSGTDMSRG
jgi:CcmD family protein